jgi:hypothetical protein
MNTRVVTNTGTGLKPKCLDCGLAIEPERLRWFAKKNLKATTCDPCAVERRAERARQVSRPSPSQS